MKKRTYLKSWVEKALSIMNAVIICFMMTIAEVNSVAGVLIAIGLVLLLIVNYKIICKYGKKEYM